MPIKCILMPILTITPNMNSQPYSVLYMPSLHYKKRPAKYTSQLSDILHYLLAGGHLRHSVYYYFLFATSRIYSLSTCTNPSSLLFVLKHKIPLPFSFLWKMPSSPFSAPFELRSKDVLLKFNIPLSFPDSYFQCLKSFPLPSDRTLF